MRTIDLIVIHCTATPAGRDVKLEEVRGWHLARGWDDIGYHYLIELDGTVRLGRPVHIPGAHVQGHNHNSIGVAYVGGVNEHMKATDTRNKNQKKALKALVGDLSRQFPSARLTGHWNLDGSKECPSFDVDTHL